MGIEIRDAVHGFVTLTEQEAAIIGHPVFQRLRRIHQLAMAYLVYPGATHTRFEHSLGVLHIANRIAQQIRLDDDDRKHVRLAALLHDIGHGPFSHVSEYVLKARNPRAERDRGVEEVHEAIGLDIIERVLFRERLLSRTEFNAVRTILEGVPVSKRDAGRRGEKRRTVLKDIVSGPMDADKLDYLLRDSRCAGVQYGVYDLDRLIIGMRRIEDRDRMGSYLAMDLDNRAALDQFVLAKHHITEQVYRHRVRRIADAMLVRAILTAIKERNRRLARAFTLRDGDADHLEYYLRCDDDVLTRLVIEGPGEHGRSLMLRLRDRRLLKEVFREKIENCQPDLAERIRREASRNKALQELEHSLANRCSIDRHLMIADFVEFKPPRRVPSEPRVDPEEITLVSPDGRQHDYNELSHLFRAGRGLMGDDHLSVYAPVDEEEPERRAARYAELHEQIAEEVGLHAVDDGARTTSTEKGE